MTFLVGIGIVLILIGGAVLFSRYSTPAVPEEDKPLPVGPEEQAYESQIHLLNPKMAAQPRIF